METGDRAHSEIKQSQSALIDFLNENLDLCVTMLQVALLTSDHRQCDKARANARTTLETVRGLMRGVRDQEARNAIHDRAKYVQQQLESLVLKRT